VRSRLFAAVATYRRPDVARRAIEALLAQSRPPDGIVVVENSEEPQLDGAYEGCEVQFVRPGANLGAAGGFALGAEVALEHGASHVVFVDDDCVLHADALRRLEQSICGRMSGAVLGPVVVAPDRETLVWEIDRPGGGLYTRHSELPRYPLPTRHMAFHGLTVSAEALRAAGGPRADLFFGGPDVEFCLRLAAHGYGLYYCPDAVATHHEVRYRRFWLLGPRKVPAGTPGHRYYVLRNRLLMWRLYRRDPVATGVGKVVAREVAGAVLAEDRTRRLALLAAAFRDGMTGDPRRTLENAVPLFG
jgi:rhamnopyranosyl-N-acetylglucosaminyl-diphospho-decaprenol beta-1,3/1,4-galactofuranosyltransferase